MFWKYFSLGFFTRVVTGVDDTLTQVPIVAYATKTKSGRIAFAIGIFLAVCVAVTLSMFFSFLLVKIPYYRYIVGGVLVFLACAIYFELFGHSENPKKHKPASDKVKFKKISTKRFLRLTGMGFVLAFTTILDDLLAYSPLFFESEAPVYYAFSGILFATFFQVYAIVYLSKQLVKLPYRKLIASLGILIIAGLVVTGVL
ncbi:MAG: hypothetical protein U9Q06_02935 [Nanoarchaeota archaeon]|nr:hypothetical protein [Nanoarchaeota archaeon]